MSTLDEAEAYLRDLVAKASRRSLLSTFMSRRGQAVVGLVENPGVGDRKKSEKQPHAKPDADAP